MFDRHDYYESSVQNAPDERDILVSIARRELRRDPLRLREDFCGSAWMSHVWAQKSRRHTALGIDLDAETVAWGHARHGTPASDARVQTKIQDVRKPLAGDFDLALALNFSYFVLKEREALLDYFRSVHRSLKHRKGLFMLDHFGGSEIAEPEPTRRRCRIPKGPRFTYVWEQLDYNPIAALSRYAIHFEPDGAKPLRKAFVYDWRVWTLPELKDLLEEAGFRDVHYYFEDDDRVFRRRASCKPDYKTWIAYITARA